MNELRILAMGDNHGNADTIERVLNETQGEEYDYVIHTGDLTNACIDGMDEGSAQLEQLVPLLDELDDRGSLVYLWGNRDYQSGFIGVGQRVDRYADIELDIGTQLPQSGSVEIDGQKFTSHPDEVDANTILVTHYEHSELFDHFECRCYLSGHVHLGRIKNKSLNTGFLFRDDSHGAEPLEGGYFEVILSEDDMDVEFHSFGGLRQGSCSDHSTLGTQFVPANWRTSCKFCYDSDEFYQQIIDSAKYQLDMHGNPITEDSVIETATDLVDESGVPSDFEVQLGEYVDTLV